MLKSVFGESRSDRSMEDGSGAGRREAKSPVRRSQEPAGRSEGPGRAGPGRAGENAEGGRDL